MNTAQVEEYNPNYIGGDINGGVIDLGQIFTRPALRSSPLPDLGKRALHLFFTPHRRERSTWHVRVPCR